MASEKLFAEWFLVDRWMGSSAFGLSMEQRGLYREMLSQAWRRQARLPNDFEQIRRLTGCSLKEWRRAWPVVSRYWRVEDDHLVNDTQRAIYAEATQRQAANKERAKQAADARWNGPPGHAPSNAPSNAQASSQAQPQASPQAMPEQCPLISGSGSGSGKEQIHKNGARASDYVNGTTDPEIGTRASRFLELYASLYPKHRNGARFLPKPALDWPTACELVQVWPDERLEKLAIVFLKTDHEFAANGSRTIRQFAALASWCDDRLRQVESERGR